jgi:hypothetical protein
VPRDDDDLLASLGRRRAGLNLSVDDVSAVVADLLKQQRKDILDHVRRLLVIVEAKSHGAATQNDNYHRNLHRRLVQVESAIRNLQRERPR